MAFIPNTNFVASVPLQYVFIDKDTGEPLSAGVVTFYSEPDYPTLKNVYQLSNNPTTGEVEFTVLRNPLILSGIGTFVDNSGNNLVPYYFPFDGTPGADDPGDPELYFVTVDSSGGVFQFSLDDWPPNAGASGGGSSSGIQSGNALSNPQFSVVSFTEDPTSGTYTYNVSGTDSRYPLAPGWELVTSGTGTVIVSQKSLALDEPSEPPFSLSVQSVGAGLTSVSIVQRLTNSPRIFGNPDGTAVISGYLLAKSSGGSSATISMLYAPPSVTPTQLFSQGTDPAGNFTELSGSQTIKAPLNTQDGSGYVDIIINLPVLTTVQITSAQLLSVENETDIPGFIQQTTQEQLNGLMWYYEPQLAYKPIPSYTIGWEFGYNPCQQLGQNVALSGLGNNLSRYIADQTIAFEAVGNVLQYSFNEQSGLTAGAIGSASQFAIIQYLDAVTARELLEGNMAVQLSSAYGFSDDLTGYVNLYYTQDATLPVMTTTANLTSGASLVATMSNGQPATFNGTWIKVPRSGLGDAPFNPEGGFNINSYTGWDATSITSSLTPTFFAIVVSFTALAAATAVSIRYCSLVKGDIATQPAPMNKAQTLAALQYYYESSYPLGVVPGTPTTDGIVAVQKITPVTANPTVLIPAYFSIPFMAPKVAAPAVTFYSPDSGTINTVFGILNANAMNILTSDLPLAPSPDPSDWNVTGITTKCATYQPATGASSLSAATATIDSSQAYIEIQYIADARLGTF